MNIVFFSIGTNLGDRDAHLKEALCKIEKNIGHIVKYSSVYETEPWGFVSENKFLNMVIKVETRLDATGVMDEILKIESTLGRVRTGVKYFSRLIDVDILFYNDLILNDKDLIIPHPHMHERKFVLVPMCEIEPGMIHPVLKKPMASLLEKCIDEGYVMKYDKSR